MSQTQLAIRPAPASAPGQTDERRAAFFRVEDILARTPAHAAAWLATRCATIRGRLIRGATVAAAQVANAELATRLTWMALRHLSEDRLALLAADYFDEVTAPAIPALGQRLVARARREGCRIILLSHNVDVVLQPLANALGADDVVCNRLERYRFRATGRLREPVLVERTLDLWARRFAQQMGVDLSCAHAYASRSSDQPLLEWVGRPCAIRPDARLRRMARRCHWPVVD